MQSSADTSKPSQVRAATNSQVFVYNDGFMAACDGLVAPRTERYTATMLFATSDKDVEIEVGDRRQCIQVAVLKPFCPKSLHAADQPFVSIALNPTHPKYRAFTRLGDPGYTAMPRSLFPTLTPRLRALRTGTFSALEVRHVFEECVEAITELLPPLRPMDPRIERVMAQLQEDHRQPLEAIAEKACLSYYRMSHLFSHEMGLSLRQYVLSLKIHAAARCMGEGMSLTATAHEAGFTDSAHLSKVWTKAFGGPPSFFLNPKSFSIAPPLETGQAAREPADTVF